MLQLCEKKTSGVLVDKKLNRIHGLHTGTVSYPVLGPQCKRDIIVREWVWKSITTLVRLPEHVTHKERTLTRLVIFAVRKRRAPGESFCSLQLPQGVFRYKMYMKDQRGASQIAARKVLVRSIDINVENFSVQVGKHGNKLTREDVEIILWIF